MPKKPKKLSAHAEPISGYLIRFYASGNPDQSYKKRQPYEAVMFADIVGDTDVELKGFVGKLQIQHVHLAINLLTEKGFERTWIEHGSRRSFQNKKRTLT